MPENIPGHRPIYKTAAVYHREVSKRGTYAKGEVKRQEILDRALAVIERDGYSHISVREIARECGLSQAGLLHYFSTKEELFVEVVRAWDDSRLEQFDPAHPIETLVSVVRENVEHPELVRLFATISVDSTDAQHPGHAYFAYRYARLRSLLADAIRDQQDRGEFSLDIDADATAVTFIAMSDGLQIQWLLDPTIEMTQRVVDVWESLQRPRSLLD